MYLYTMTESFNGVKKFLDRLQLGNYWDIFKAKGYDRESDLKDLDDYDLDHMHIKGSDRQRILQAGDTISIQFYNVKKQLHILCFCGIISHFKIFCLTTEEARSEQREEKINL